jgi:multiple sugar transport system permease protein
VASLIVLSFIDSWNMVEQPLIFLRDAFKYPMSIFLTWIFDAEPALGFVCGLLAMLPALYLFLYCRDELVNGIGQSIIK